MNTTPDVICPCCHQVTPPWLHCFVCNAPLGDLLEQVFKEASALEAKAAKRLSSRAARSGDYKPLSMDAQLRRTRARIRKQGTLKPPTSSTGENELAVIAKLNIAATDATQLITLIGQLKVSPVLKRELKRVKIVAVIPPVKGDPDQTTIATARIPESLIEELRKLKEVVSLKASRRLRPFLERTLEESCARAQDLAKDRPGRSKGAAKELSERGGKGVVVGLVDFGLDFVHYNFRDQHKKTRILALWDQKADYTHENEFGYGRVFQREEIDKSLQEKDPYKALGYELPSDSSFDVGAHGTYVADVASGNGNGSSAPGVAPNADIVFVDLSTANLGAQAVGNTFGDSAQLLEAVKFIFDTAGDSPCVVNLSIGSNDGPHDGTTLVEQALSRLVRARNNRAIVAAAGNTYDEALHALGEVREGQAVDLKVRIPQFDATCNEVEIWYAGGDRFTIDLIDPDGKFVARVAPGEEVEQVSAGSGLLSVYSRLDDPTNEAHTITVFLEGGVRDGVWTLRLYGQKVSETGGGFFHAWIERDERGQTRFVAPEDDLYQISNEGTLNSIACHDDIIVVGSCNANAPGSPAALSSSAGPTRDGRSKPDLAAPGELILAARSGTYVLRRRQSGTSLAAATVTGVVALMLAEASELAPHKQAKRGRAKFALSAQQIRALLTETAVKHERERKGWDPRLGYGRVCAAKAVQRVRELVGSVPPPSVA